MLIVYHSADFDGKACGAIAHRKYPEAELWGMNYGEKFPYEKLQTHKEVLMMDFGLQPFSEMVTLAGQTDLTWIDHHKSAMEEHAKTKLKIKGVRDMKFAACELAWQFLFPEKTIPQMIELLGRYDIWDHKDPLTVPFQYGMQFQKDQSPLAPMWGQIFIGDLDFFQETLKVGKIILEYVTNQNARNCKSGAFEAKFQGYRVIAINHMAGSSQVFESVYDPTKHDIMVIFYWSRKGHWNVSLYSTKPEVDVGSIAKKLNGGGHLGAAGFQYYSNPLSLFEGISAP